ncbi:MAG TPA: cation:proton antiporter subunit C [Nannocystis sp.]
MRATLYAVIGVALCSLGLHAAIARRHLMRKVLALNILGSGVFLVLVAIAARDPARPDPVPHAMVLTGIVVAVCATALALSLARRLRTERGSTYLPEDHAS